MVKSEIDSEIGKGARQSGRVAIAFKTVVHDPMVEPLNDGAAAGSARAPTWMSPGDKTGNGRIPEQTGLCHLKMREATYDHQG